MKEKNSIALTIRRFMKREDKDQHSLRGYKRAAHKEQRRNAKQQLLSAMCGGTT